MTGSTGSALEWPTEEFWVLFWGVRGSLPVSGRQFQRYGGNTACVEMHCGKHTIFDAGSGIRPAGLSLYERGITDFDVFFTYVTTPY